ncbi:MAG: hypothetical protein QNJ16_03300 [Rhodobacter sp.]|nr:hypothetical protein [Rhodobacter sp.]
MAKNRRWVTSVTKEAAKLKIEMPWTRGTRREAWIAKRAGDDQPRAARA